MIDRLNTIDLYEKSPRSRPLSVPLEIALDEVMSRKTQTTGRPAARMWQPDHPAVVLGLSGRLNQEVNESAAAALGVPIFRRFSGGGTVYLDRNVFCWSVALPSALLDDLPSIGASYAVFSRPLLNLLAERSSAHVFRCRDFDLCAGERKIGGSAQARRRGVALHHGTIMTRPLQENTERLLPPPPKEPAYRRGRRHEAFMTSLYEIGIELDPDGLGAAWKDRLAASCTLRIKAFSQSDMETACHQSRERFGNEKWIRRS